MGYQNFPWEGGSSRSFEKLVSLSLPVLKGKSVLDVGCNEGYFCGWAAFQQAAYVRGIDKDSRSIQKAKLWFPECSFACEGWDALGPRTYDLVLCLSALHYAADQQALIDLLMARLNPGGLFVLEVGIADGDVDDFVPVQRSINAENDDTKFFPTFTKMRSLLRHYTYKYMGQSVSQRGDPLPRHVFHIQHKRPLAVLFMDEHYSGKSAVAQSILRPGLFRIAGEQLYHDIHDGKIAASDALKRHITCVPGTPHMMPPAITAAICQNGLLPEFARVCFDLAGQRDFVLEHYIPDKYRLAVAQLCDAAGYFVVDIALFAAHQRPWQVMRPPYKQYAAYQKYLEGLCDIDEAAYLAANPDVAQAVADGTLPDAKTHYLYHGRREKRKLRP